MEVHGRQPGEPSPVHDRFRRRQEALRESTRKGVHDARKAREGLTEARQEEIRKAEAERRASRAEAQDRSVRGSGAREDVLDLSLTRDREGTEETRAKREAHVRELREAHEQGRLNTPERLDRAAEGILRG